MVVRGGSVRGGSLAAVRAVDAGKVVAEGALLEARPEEGQEAPAATVLAEGPGSAVVLRRCELLQPGGEYSRAAPSSKPQPALHHRCMQTGGGARATAADCACGGPITVLGQGSSLLHSGLAFPPGLARSIVTQGGGTARELPAAAGAVAGGAAGRARSGAS